MKKLFITLLCVFSITQAFCQLGMLDSTFQSYGYAAFRVKAAKEVSDGKILIATDGGLRRLNADGTIDYTFFNAFNFSSNLDAMAVQSDGKIIISGNFKNLDNSFFGNFARLNPDGTLDHTFKGDRNVSNIYSITLRKDGKILICGYFEEYNKSLITGIALLESDGMLDPSFKSSLTHANVYINSCAIQEDNKIVISGSLKLEDSSMKRIIRLNANGSVDNSFITGTGPDDDVRVLLLLSSGNFLIGGSFKEYDGQAINRYARLNIDGSLDKDFNAGSISGNSFRSSAISTFKELPDGKIIIGGYFTNYYGAVTSGLIQIKADGTFDKNIITTSIPVIEGIEILWNGKILVYGLFQSANSKPRNKIFLLNTDYTLDVDFNPGDGADNSINDFILLTNGKIVIVGSFTAYNQSRSWGVARLLSNGLLDPTFYTGRAFEENGSSMTLSAIARQDDGKFIIVGSFGLFNGKPVRNIVRLLADGSIDESFKYGNGLDSYIDCIKIEPDGKIIIAGGFFSYSANSVKTVFSISRLNPDGSLDESFSPGEGFDAPILGIETMPDNKILVVGLFSNYDNTHVNRIALLNADGSLNSDFKIGSGANDNIYCITLDKDKIYLGGAFNSFNAYSTDRIVRLNLDGSIDKEFFAQNLPGYSSVSNITVQPNGKIITTTPFARLNYDGSTDKDFNLNSEGGDIKKLIIQPDGKFLIGGGFQYYNNTMVGNICRIEGGDITTPSGIFSTKEFQSFSSVYPTPTTDNLNFNVNGTSNTYDLSIYSITGLEILNTAIPSGQSVINTDKFPMGIYIYKISNEEGQYNTGKIIINKQK